MKVRFSYRTMSLEQIKTHFFANTEAFANLSKTLSAELDKPDCNVSEIKKNLEHEYQQITALYDNIKQKTTGSVSNSVRLTMDRYEHDNRILMSRIDKQNTTNQPDTATPAVVPPSQVSECHTSNSSLRKKALLEVAKKTAELEAKRKQDEIKAQQEELEVRQLQERNKLARQARSNEHNLIEQTIQAEQHFADTIEDPNNQFLLQNNRQTAPVSTTINNAQTAQQQVQSPHVTQDDMKALIQMLGDKLSNKPLALEPLVFNGDPMTYPDWSRSFSAMIARQPGCTQLEKLHHLRRYVTGPAREAINGHFLLQSENAYDLAMETLADRFGRHYLVAQAFRTKLEKWPRIPPKGHKELLKFSDYLNQCLAAMTCSADLNLLNDPQ
jgi:hypothetical protein